MATLFTDQAKAKIVEAVKAVEATSSAEIVVAVRARSDDYREVDLAVGLALALVTLTVLIYIPFALDENLMPIETLAAFVVGSLLVNKVGALKRMLVSKKRRLAKSLTAARASFVESGVSRTRGRSGILVFVSELERAVCIVPDIGIDPAKLGAAWTTKVLGLERAAEGLDAGAFSAALGELGPLLSSAYPRGDKTDNELPDAPNVG